MSTPGQIEDEPRDSDSPRETQDASGAARGGWFSGGDDYPARPVGIAELVLVVIALVGYALSRKLGSLSAGVAILAALAILVMGLIAADVARVLLRRRRQRRAQQPPRAVATIREKGDAP